LNGGVHRIDDAERRSRLGLRHRLAAPATTVQEAAAGMVGLHSSDPATVFLSAWARVHPFRVDDLEEALYERRDLVRMLGMRRTLFVAPVDMAAVLHHACARALAPSERKRLLRLVEEEGVAADGDAWLSRAESDTLAALSARGEATATELREDVPALRTRLSFGEGKSWGGTVGVSTRVLFLLATEGRIVRGRPRGSWISSQYRWAPTESWLGGPLPDIDAGAAGRDLVRRWLRAFGPGTPADLKWWTGWPLGRTRRVLAEVDAVEVELDHGTGHVLPDDLEPSPHPDPWVALLPSLDPTVMGWRERDWYLGDHRDLLFDRNGNAGPTVWVDGAVVGGWTQAEGGEVVSRLLEDVGGEAEAMIQDEADRLTAWLDGVRVTPRFRTPLEKTTAGG
jgi:hypothetical protein